VTVVAIRKDRAVAITALLADVGGTTPDATALVDAVTRRLA
jgi:hypothetical protein